MSELKISRVTRAPGQARQSYNKMSRWYDLFAGSEKKFTEIGLRLLNVKVGEKALEIGFGTGQALIEMARTGAKIYGVDISDGMLAIAQKRVNKAGLDERVELRIEDANHLSFKDGEFDAVFISFALELFDTPEILTVLGECHRVLREGGHLAVVSLEKKQTAICRLYEWGHEKFPTLLDCRPIFTRKLVEEADFKIERVQEKSMWGLPIAIVLGRKPFE